MATYPPPTYTEPLSIFNPIYFESDTTLITIDYANKHYLKYPVAQGTETLQQIIVNGTSTFNDTISANQPLTMSGATANDRIINSVYYELQDQSSLTTTDGAIYANSGIFYYDNNTNGGSHTFAVNTTGGSQVIPLSVNATTTSINPSITFPDSSVQTSAYTGAKTLAGSYTLTNMTIDSNGKITALSNGSASVPANLTPNSLTISPTSWPNNTAGIYNNYNQGAVLAFYGSGGSNNSTFGIFAANTSAKWDSNYNYLLPASVMTYRLNFTFWNSSNWGQTSCMIDFYPSRWTQGQQVGDKYNINNKIDGNASFNYTNATYAPSGRQYWTYNQSFSGVSGANAMFGCHQGYFQLYFAIPDNSYNYQCSIEAVNTSAITANGNGMRIVIN